MKRGPSGDQSHGSPGRRFDTGLSKPLIHIHNTVSVVGVSKLFKTCRSRACPWGRSATGSFRQSLDSPFFLQAKACLLSGTSDVFPHLSTGELTLFDRLSTDRGAVPSGKSGRRLQTPFGPIPKAQGAS